MATPFVFLLLCIQSVLCEPAVMPGEVFVRERIPREVFCLDTEGRYSARGPVREILEQYQCESIFRPFPRIERYPDSELNRVYLLVFPESIDVFEAIRTLQGGDWFDYVEPRYLRRAAKIQIYPNDPLLSAQWFLEDIEAFTGWGITPGDTSVVIAILDTGINWHHPDLQSCLAVNAAEDVNQNGVFDPGDLDSLDADGDQYVDNVLGWDFVALPPSQLFPGEDGAPPDNDPMDFDGHGTHCAGDASAVTDNAEGIAGVGWRTQILPVRVGYRAQDGQGYVGYSVEGILYAANHGATVISMSYGGEFFSNTEQSAVNYAADLGVVLVAAAGNDNCQEFSYPAHYDNVIAVAATDQYRNRADFSNYGTWVDVAAPGVQIYSTTVSGAYGNMEGTSMATPIAAGVCGLVKSLRPEWTSQQVEEHLKARCDTLSSFPPELGGRHLNMFKALDIVVRVDSFAIDDSNGNQNGRPDFGEEVDLLVQVCNSFQDLEYVHLSLSSDDSLVSVTDGFSDLGPVQYGECPDNMADPLSFEIGPGSGSSSIKLMLHISDATGYTLTRELTFHVGHADWLIVNADQDDAPDRTSYYSTELETRGIPYDTWRISQGGSPSEILNQYEKIIWFTGERSTGGVAEADGAALGQFLDDGKGLFLSGQNLLSTFTALIPDFAAEYLSCTVADSQVTDYVLEGVDSGNLGLSGSIYIFGSGGAGNQTHVDGLSISGDAIPEVLFDSSNPDLLAAYSVDAEYKLVVLSFGFEAINGEPPQSVSRSDMMAKVVEFFTSTIAESSLPCFPGLRLESIHPNPFNHMVRLRIQLARSGLVTWSVYNMRGEKILGRSREMREPGIYEIRWSPGPEIPSGSYLVRVCSDPDEISARFLYLK